MQDTAPIGIIGLGLVGTALSERLIDAGIPLIGFDIAPNGTGDAVAALFSAHWIESGDVALALGKAASSIFAVLEATSALGERELQLVAAQDGLVAPSRRFTAEKL